MQGIYSYMSETNHVSRLYSVAAVLYLRGSAAVRLLGWRVRIPPEA